MYQRDHYDTQDNKPTQNKHPLFKIANAALVDFRVWWNHTTLYRIKITSLQNYWYKN